MTSKVFPVSLVVVFVNLWLNATPPLVLGEVAGPDVTLNGIQVNAGTTLLNPSLVSTHEAPASIHLSAGRLIRLSPHTTAAFSTISNQDLRIDVSAGLATMRNPNGVVASLAGRFILYENGELQVADPAQEGVVAVLRARAGSGRGALRVNDTSQVRASSPILVRSRDGSVEEIHYIKSLGRREISLTAGLANSFEADSLVIQGPELDRAVSAGTVIVGNPAETGGGIPTRAVVGILAGAGGAGAVAALAGGGGGSSGTVASRTVPTN